MVSTNLYVLQELESMDKAEEQQATERKLSERVEEEVRKEKVKLHKAFNEKVANLEIKLHKMYQADIAREHNKNMLMFEREMNKCRQNLEFMAGLMSGGRTCDPTSQSILQFETIAMCNQMNEAIKKSKI
jgi:hypothetical protein